MKRRRAPPHDIPQSGDEFRTQRRFYPDCPAASCTLSEGRRGFRHVTPARQQVYDHRLVRLVQRTRVVTLATACAVPASTARGWLGRVPVEVVTHPVFVLSDDDLRVRLVRLEHRLARLGALLRIALALLAVLRPDFTRLRVPEGRDKRLLCSATPNCS